MLKNVLYIFASIPPALSLRTWDSLQFKNREAKAKRLMNSGELWGWEERDLAIKPPVPHKPPYNKLPPNQMCDSRDATLYMHSRSPGVNKMDGSASFYCRVT